MFLFAAHVQLVGVLFCISFTRRHVLLHPSYFPPVDVTNTGLHVTCDNFMFLFDSATKNYIEWKAQILVD